MLKWVAKKDGRTILGFGLEAKNIEYLQKGKPIIARVSIGGTMVDVVIHYGETKEKMLEDLKDAGIDLPDGKVTPTHIN